MTVALTVSGPYAVAGLLHGLAALESLGTGAIGGFAVLAAMAPNGTVVYAETQTGGSSELYIQSSWLTYDRAALISSGPHRPEPLHQFLPAADGIGLVTGHRLPNRPFQNTRLNIAALNLLKDGHSPEAAISQILSQAPEADAGLMAIDAQGKIAWGNSARVKRRADLFTYDSSHGAHQLALMMNSIYCAPHLYTTLPEIISDIALGHARHLSANRTVPLFEQKLSAYSLPLTESPIQPADRDQVVINTDNAQIVKIYSSDPNINHANGRWAVIQHGTPVVNLRGQSLGVALHDVVANVFALTMTLSEPLTRVTTSTFDSAHTFVQPQELFIFGAMP